MIEFMQLIVNHCSSFEATRWLEGCSKEVLKNWKENIDKIESSRKTYSTIKDILRDV